MPCSKTFSILTMIFSPRVFQAFEENMAPLVSLALLGFRSVLLSDCPFSLFYCHLSPKIWPTLCSHRERQAKMANQA